MPIGKNWYFMKNGRHLKTDKINSKLKKCKIGKNWEKLKKSRWWKFEIDKNCVLMKIIAAKM